MNLKKSFFILLLATTQLPASDPFVTIELGEHAGIRSLQRQVGPQVEKAVRDAIEAFLAEKYDGNNNDASRLTEQDFPKWQNKDRLVTSLYYLSGTSVSADEQAFVSALDLMLAIKRKFGPVSDVAITRNGDLFGAEKEDVVVKLSDDGGKLGVLHDAIQNMFNKALKFGQEECPGQPALFNKAAAERFPFVPHVTLGRIDMSKLTVLAQRLELDEEALRDVVAKKIKKVIKQLPELKPEQAGITSSTFDLYGANRKSLKKYTL